MRLGIKAIWILLGIVAGLAQAQNYPTISYREAANHVDKIVWIEGNVFKAERSPEGIYLLFHPDRIKYVSVFIPREYLRNFKGGPDYLYLNKSIKAIGKIQRDGRRLMIAVNEPKQIKIVTEKEG